MKTKLILRTDLCPGDIIMLTAAVRDLHQTYPNQYTTDVRTPHKQLWFHNPYITPLKERDPDVRVIDCHYPLIHQSNQRSSHFIQGYIDFLSRKLSVPIRPTLFRGEIFMSDSERNQKPVFDGINLEERHIWLIVAGGKYDFTIKWWAHDRYQEVVNHFKGRITFVQVGRSDHNHFPLQNVIDLRGKTTIRDLIRLTYHCRGVVTPVTFAMHLAAAVEMRENPLSRRPCVVIAGAREPPQWEAYPFHQFIHTVGMLPCCRSGGCWKARVLPLGDGDEKDLKENLCVDVVNSLPRCMNIITAADVVRRMEMYLECL